jgi:hypothetical protein
MVKQSINKPGWVAAAGVLALCLAVTPARAHHEPDIVVPVVVAFALGALWNHGHRNYSHGYRYEHHGHYRQEHKSRGVSHKRNYSHGNYSHGYSKSRHDSPERSSHGRKQRHSSNRGGHSGSRRIP